MKPGQEEWHTTLNTRQFVECIALPQRFTLAIGLFSRYFQAKRRLQAEVQCALSLSQY
jgi:hypothetical protein